MGNFFVAGPLHLSHPNIYRGIRLLRRPPYGRCTPFVRLRRIKRSCGMGPIPFLTPRREFDLQFHRVCEY